MRSHKWKKACISVKCGIKDFFSPRCADSEAALIMCFALNIEFVWLHETSASRYTMIRGLLIQSWSGGDSPFRKLKRLDNSTNTGSNFPFIGILPSMESLSVSDELRAYPEPLLSNDLTLPSSTPIIPTLTTILRGLGYFTRVHCEPDRITMAGQPHKPSGRSLRRFR